MKSAKKTVDDSIVEAYTNGVTQATVTVIAPVVEWQTRTLEGRMGRLVQVQVLSGAPLKRTNPKGFVFFGFLRQNFVMISACMNY